MKSTYVDGLRTCMKKVEIYKVAWKILKRCEMIAVFTVKELLYMENVKVFILYLFVLIAVNFYY